MMNTFDFWAIEARSTRVRDLTSAGIERSAIRTERHFVTYGRRSYPRNTYIASVAHVDAITGREAVDRAEAEARERFPNADIRVAYHARD